MIELKTIDIASLANMTLEEFIQDERINSHYIKFKTLSSFYRKGAVAVDAKVYRKVLTRANTTNKRRAANITSDTKFKAKATGLYKELDDLSVALAKKYGFDGIYVESVLNDFLPEVLNRYGYRQVNHSHGTDNFFKEV